MNFGVPFSCCIKFYFLLSCILRQPGHEFLVLQPTDNMLYFTCIYLLTWTDTVIFSNQWWSTCKILYDHWKNFGSIINSENNLSFDTWKESWLFLIVMQNLTSCLLRWRQLYDLCTCFKLTSQHFPTSPCLLANYK